MRRIVMSVSAAVIFMTACATFGGKWSESKIDKLSERCLAENDELKPVVNRWYNLSTQERTKKKKEMDDYKKKRIELYQSLHTFRTIYKDSVDDDGTCRRKECVSLGHIRKQIIAGCPTVGESFPNAVRDKP